MNLWIRSQDKLSLVKPLDLELYSCLKTPICDENTTDIRAYLSKQEDDYIILGTYTTKERALEVLDEIQKILTPKIQVTPEFRKSDLTGNCQWIDKQELIQYNTYVYEMPEE